MRILVFIDDRLSSYSAFYKAMEIVKPNDWIILVGKAHYGRGIGHLSNESMAFFGRLMDKRRIKNLHFLEYGKTKNILRNVASKFVIDLALITPYSSKTKKLYDNLKSLGIDTMAVTEYLPADKSLIPKPLDKRAPVPSERSRAKLTESESAIPINTPSFDSPDTSSYSSTGGFQQHESKQHHMVTSASEHSVPERMAASHQDNQFYKSSDSMNLPKLEEENEEEYNYRMTLPSRLYQKDNPKSFKKNQTVTFVSP